MSFEEPPINPEEDTRPTGTFPQVSVDETPSIYPQATTQPAWRGLLGLVFLLVALGFTAASVFVLVTGGDSDEPEPATPVAGAPTASPTPPPTDIPVTQPPSIALGGEVIDVLPTLDAETANALLARPLEMLIAPEVGQVERGVLEPFTIIPDRPRNEIITYTAVKGDSIEAIADRFGLEPESIAWSNPRYMIQALQPGYELVVPPVDGVYVKAVGSTRTIADYANQYKINDPYVVLDSEFNDLPGLGPDSVPPSGTPLFIPGGEAEEVVWVAEIEVTEGGGSSGAGSGPGRVVFQNGQPGSCAPQDIVGGTNWVNPLAPGTYTITRGFSSYHTGIDLAGSPGTQVRAANGGRVIFAGWNSFGYGYAIAIIHGPNMTVYGHLQEGGVFVSCGQDVVAGQVIGAMGSTGQSTGPHLHFEIRSRAGNTYAPYNPAATIGF